MSSFRTRLPFEMMEKTWISVVDTWSLPAFCERNHHPGTLFLRILQLACAKLCEHMRLGLDPQVGGTSWISQARGPAQRSRGSFSRPTRPRSFRRSWGPTTCSTTRSTRCPRCRPGHPATSSWRISRRPYMAIYGRLVHIMHVFDGFRWVKTVKRFFLCELGGVFWVL